MFLGKQSWLIHILTGMSSRHSWRLARQYISRKLCHIYRLQNVWATCIHHHFMVDWFLFLSGEFLWRWSFARGWSCGAGIYFLRLLVSNILCIKIAVQQWFKVYAHIVNVMQSWCWYQGESFSFFLISWYHLAVLNLNIGKCCIL